jgi:hypothetical protein
MFLATLFFSQLLLKIVLGMINSGWNKLTKPAVHHAMTLPFVASGSYFELCLPECRTSHIDA